MGNPDSSSSAVSPFEQWAARLTGTPRLWRIVLSLLITLELAILAWVVVDRVIINEFGSMTSTFVAVAVGLVAYAIGWWALVGFDDAPDHPWRAGRPAVWFLAVGLGGMVVLIMVAVFGLAFGYLM